MAERQVRGGDEGTRRVRGLWRTGSEHETAETSLGGLGPGGRGHGRTPTGGVEQGSVVVTDTETRGVFGAMEKEA